MLRRRVAQALLVAHGIARIAVDTAEISVSAAGGFWEGYLQGRREAEMVERGDMIEFLKRSPRFHSIWARDFDVRAKHSWTRFDRAWWSGRAAFHHGEVANEQAQQEAVVR